MIGALLAGGAGRRMGGGKPARILAGRPLLAYPADALREVCDRVAVVAKPDAVLPAIDGVERWDEPYAPRHPLTGIVAALERAGGPVLVCAADMPFVRAATLRPLLGGGPAVAVAGGFLQPLLAVYLPDDLELLRAAEPDAPLLRVLERLPQRQRIAVRPDEARSVDTLDELAAAERELGAGC